MIILTEHHLSATFRPKELIDSERNIRSVAGVLKRRSKQHQHRGGVAILYRNTSNLKIEQHRITDGLNGSSHQPVSWTIHSPLIVDPIHITGVYVRPSEGEVEESFHTLTQQDHYPDREIHVYTGDFNAHVSTDQIYRNPQYTNRKPTWDPTRSKDPWCDLLSSLWKRILEYV